MFIMCCSENDAPSYTLTVLVFSVLCVCALIQYGLRLLQLHKSLMASIHVPACQIYHDHYTLDMGLLAKFRSSHHIAKNCLFFTGSMDSSTKGLLARFCSESAYHQPSQEVALPLF